MWRLLWVFLAALVSAGNGLTDEEFSRFPQLFHLDDYERCLARPHGLYCLGDFHLKPVDRDDSTYRLILEYSANSLNFNRTVIHRGYCVSERCPLRADQYERAKWYTRSNRSQRAVRSEREIRSERANRSEQDSRTARFERCVHDFYYLQGYNTTTVEVQYCHTPADKARPVHLDAPKIAFLIVIIVILLLNVIGTVYDLRRTGDDEIELLMAWSVQSNVRRLFSAFLTKEKTKSGLDKLHGMRVLIMLVEIGLHTALLHYAVYTHNARDFENMLHNRAMMPLHNSAGMVQLFVVLSSFLVGHLLLQRARQRPLGPSLLPLQLLKRFIRLTPVHILAVGFAATWWPLTGKGPLWSTVEAESATCSQKFWTHPLYIYNFFQPDKMCLLPTWFLAVDMQLSLVVTGLTLVLSRWPKHALKILAGLFVTSVLVNGGLAYHFKWDVTLYYAVPEVNRAGMETSRSFQQYYMAPWGSLPPSLVGLFLAHLYQRLQEKGFKASQHKWLVWVMNITPGVLLALLLTGLWLQHATSRVILAAFTALERPLLAIVAAVFFFGLITRVDFYLKYMLPGPLLVVLGRMTLPVMLIHWMVIVSFLGSISVPLHFSLMGIVWESTSISILTYLLAIPVSIMIEIPFQRVFSAIIKIS